MKKALQIIGIIGGLAAMMYTIDAQAVRSYAALKAQVEIREHLVTRYYSGCTWVGSELKNNGTTGYLWLRCTYSESGYRHPDFPADLPAWLADDNPYQLAIIVQSQAGGADVEIYCSSVTISAQPIRVIVDCLPDQRAGGRK